MTERFLYSRAVLAFSIATGHRKRQLIVTALCQTLNMTKAATHSIAGSRFYCLMAAWLLLMLALPVGAADIRARVSATEISALESFQLIFEISGDPDGPPEFAVLAPDFEILGRSESRSVRSIGGQVSRSTRLNLTLAPRTTGRLTIPAVSFGKDWSNPVSLQVAPRTQGPASQAGDDVLFEVEVTPGDVYVQEQILFTARLFLGGVFARMHLGEPEIGDPEAILRRLGETRYEMRRNGRSYSVLERRYAVFPARSGRLTLGPVTFHGLTVTADPADQGDSRVPPQDPNATGQVRRVRSEAAQVTVKPARVLEEALPWLPARNIQLMEAWPADAPELAVGEPLVRRVTLVADGLTAVQLPPLPLATTVDFEHYPQPPYLRDQPFPAGVTGRRRESITLIPTGPGTHTLPAVEIEWWNTLAGRRQTARLPPRVVKVVDVPGGAGTGLPAGPTPEPAAGAFPSLPKRQTRRPSETPPGRDWTELPSLPDGQPREAGAQETGFGDYWPWIALLLAFGWFFTLAAWWAGRKRSPPRAAGVSASEEALAPAPRPRPKSVVETAIEGVQAAYRDRDAQAAKGALLRWANIVWRDSPPSNLSALAQRCPTALRKEILALDRALYSPEPEPWYERPVWTLLSRVSDG